MRRENDLRGYINFVQRVLCMIRKTHAYVRSRCREGDPGEAYNQDRGRTNETRDLDKLDAHSGCCRRGRARRAMGVSAGRKVVALCAVRGERRGGERRGESDGGERRQGRLLLSQGLAGWNRPTTIAGLAPG
jgi:hypothetical protein